ncbi:HEAT repeat domain-containing protein [Kamptonema formosum]|uniref:HEAT repeat domain-containing protein n=1 Tax=Kamptonema formosum TaxID=331992 RepID=UPI00034C230D|nr:HEAT repeat domain-containing protein [Oscillatoria sp. PCC 10802]
MTDEPQISIFTTDANLVVRSWDAWLERATGQSASAACGRNLTALIPDLESRGLLLRFQRVLEQGVVETLAPAFHHYLIPCPPQRPSKHFDRMQQRVTIAPLRENDRIAGTVVTIEDVTARKDKERDLAEQLASAKESDRLLAARRLGEIEGLELSGDGSLAASPLLEALGDESWRVRRVAVDSLALRAGTSTTATLLRAIRENHRNLSVLNSALQVLALSDVDVIEPLIEFLNDPDDVELRIYAALALGERKDPRAIPALIRALADADTNVRYHTIEAIGQLRAAAAVDALLAIAESGDFFLAFPALDALRRIGDPIVAPHLVPLLADELLCEPAAAALGLLGDREVVAPLVELLNGPNPPARAIASSLAALYERYETVYREGSHIADLVRLGISERGTQNVLDALQVANAEELKALVQVLGWLEGPPVERALARLLRRTAVRKAVLDALVRKGTRVKDLLVSLLSEEDLETRKAAVVALGRIGDTRAVPALINLLAEDPELAVAAAEALAQIGDRGAFEALLLLIGHPDAAVRQATIAALDSLGHPDMSARMVELLRDPNPYIRESAVKIAGYFAFAECLDLLFERCTDPDERVRRAAIEHIPYLEDPRVLPALARALESDSSAVRAAAARAFSLVESDRAFPYLKQALCDPDPWVRYYAARSTGTHGYREAVAALTHLVLTDRANQVRAAAVEALGRIAHISQAETIVKLLAPLATDESGDGDLARAAIAALGMIEHPDAGGPLLCALQSPDPQRRCDALVALGKRGGEGAVGAILWLAASDPEPSVASAATDALARISCEEAIAALIDLSADQQRVQACIAALLRTEARTGVSFDKQIEWIGRGLSHPQAQVRCAVVEVLTRLKHPHASELLTNALDDAEPAVRLTAVRSLGYLGNRSAEQKLAALSRTDPDPAVRRAAQKVLQS